MSGQDKHDATHGRLRVVSSHSAARMTSSVTGAVSRTDHAERAEGAPLPPRRPGFEALMPEPSANQRRFMELMSMGEGSASGIEDDPAFTVGMAMFFWRFCRRGMPMPKRAMALLERHAAAGDPTCIMVRDWLRKKLVKTGRRSLWVFDGGKA